VSGSEAYDESQNQPVQRTRAQAASVMVVSGMDYGTVAQVMGFSSTDEVRSVVEAELAAQYSEVDRQKLRLLLSSRLEKLWSISYSRAQNDRNPTRETATQNALKVADRLAKLWGVDEPTQVVLHSATTEQIQAWVADVMAEKMKGLPEEKPIIPGQLVGA
jgi:hypothetical protein